MFNMFSAYYKTKLKNKLKNKSQQTISFTNSRCSLPILSWSTHSVLSPSFLDLLTTKLSLSLLIFADLHTTASSLSFSLQICSFSVCPSQLLHFISGVVAASLDRRRWRFISDAAGASSRCNHYCSIQLPWLLLLSQLHLCYVSCWYFSFLRLAYNRIWHSLGFNLLGQMVNVENPYSIIIFYFKRDRFHCHGHEGEEIESDRNCWSCKRYEQIEKILTGKYNINWASKAAREAKGGAEEWRTEEERGI